MSVTKDDFEAELLRAFPSSYPPQLHVVHHGCDECAQLEIDFVGKEWTAVAEATIDRHFADLPLFTPDALRYFLPAFLRAALADPNSNIAEFLMYSLAPSGIHATELSMFTTLQCGVVVAFLDLMAESNEGITDKVWTKARERWQPA